MPRPPRSLLHGLGACDMSAYEYTMDPTTSPSSHPRFLAAFHDALLHLKVADVYALTANAPESKMMTEIEMADVSATVLATPPSGLPSAHDESTTTDWIATDVVANDGLPGAVQMKCTTTRSDNHYNFASTKQYDADFAGLENPDDTSQLLLNGEVLPSDGETYAMVRRARDLIAAT
ncbi:MAG: hypothetical protein M1826_007681 [Phylliscum demangeonii]|nr:MAG: hypothetical protein M1826_007681 [Phylliscum demangeonii]